MILWHASVTLRLFVVHYHDSRGHRGLNFPSVDHNRSLSLSQQPLLITLAGLGVRHLLTTMALCRSRNGLSLTQTIINLLKQH
jgi:hypothetical protein